MQKLSFYNLTAILILSIPSNAQQVKLLKTTNLSSYPSASALEFYNNTLFVMGDDATHLYLLDSEHKIKDSIKIFSSETRRISKDEKTDLEAAAIYNNRLVLISSFSTKKRNKTIVINLLKNKGGKKRSFSKKLKVKLNETNIEGADHIGHYLVLANRANLTNRTNQLILTGYSNGRGIYKVFKIIDIELPQTKDVVGISGLNYIPEKDILLFTASTEQTTNAYSDGAIGNSYLGYIEDFSKKMHDPKIIIKNIINISPHLSKNHLYKIESLAVEKITGDEIILHLAADDDNGQSTLFKINFLLSN